MNILITPGTWTASLTIMESLAKQGHHIFLLDSDPYCAGFRSKYCKKGIIVPPETDTERYLLAIEHLITTEQFDLLIPTSDLSTEFLSKERERMLPYVEMLLPSKDLIELARFKDRTYRFALENGIAIPRTYFPQTVDEVIALAQNLDFPCVVKKPRGTANKGNSYFYNSESLIDHYLHLTAQDEWPVIQEFIRGEFYGFLAVAQEGEVLDGLMYKTKQQYSSAGSMSPYCVSVTEEEFINTAKRIVRLLNWTGALNIDFLQDPEGHLLMLEINPRLSGSLTFAYKLGVDLPDIYRSLAFRNVEKRFHKVHYPSQVVFRYVLPSEMIYTIKNKGHLFKFLLNFLNFNIKTDIPWGDHGLIISQLWHLWWYQRDRTKEIGGVNLEFIKKNQSANTKEHSTPVHAISQ
jgi:carbamoylphosphate synthase large subunit